MVLAPNSSVRIPRQFTEHRDIALAGEAHFDVTHTFDAPFIVRTGDVAIRVLGTTFDVRRYASDHETHIAVMSGKVAVGNQQHPRQTPVTIANGSVARIMDSTVVVTTSDDLSQYSEWTRGALVFHDATVRDILATVGHWYNYDFRVSDSVLAQRHLSVQFDGESFDVVLTTLQTLLNVSMAFDGRVVMVVPRRDASVPRSANPRTPLQPRMEVGL